ncbi:elongation factor G [Shimia biformata]|uniref:elongation factor G n=1 Tax=Shimia biformata TaxID=1294299 RepID=UPI0019514C4C|nr:elongation factor G [Shimia biformata]
MTDQTVGARCAAIVGPYGSGKSTLFEDLLFISGAIPRRGTIKEGNTVADSTPEARARGMSTELTVASTRYLEEPWTLIDCPGSVELTCDAQGAMMVADIVVVVCEPQMERAVTVSPILKFLDDRDIPHVIYINKMDQADASVRMTFEALQAISERPLVLREIPMRDSGGAVTGMVDLVSERTWRWNPHERSELVALPDRLKDEEELHRNEMLEALADFDDALMEELLEDVVPSTDEIYANLVKDLQDDLIVPVFFGSAENENGIQRLFKALRHETPSVTETAARRGIDTADGPVVQVFKTWNAGQSGKMSTVRVWSGNLPDGQTLGNDRIGGISTLLGKKTTRVDGAAAGDVVALGRMGEAQTGDILGPDGKRATNWPDLPAPLYAFAIAAERQSEEVKLTGALAKLTEEDPSLAVTQEGDTGEYVLSGQGEVHLQIALARMKRDFGLDVSHAPPQVPYKETIRKPAEQAARHKKQSGGHGEFADVKIRITPQARGAGFEFSDTITGGVVPKQYIPAVEKGVTAFLARGPLGFPVVDIAVTLTDGGFHSVDSSDMAFQKAAIQAMLSAMPDCSPVLLEPVMAVSVSVPSEFTPKVQRIVTGRRGQLLGYDTKPGWKGWDEVQAMMPQAEIGDLIIELRSASLGVGTYEARFDHLQDIVGREADEVIHTRKQVVA